MIFLLLLQNHSASLDTTAKEDQQQDTYDLICLVSGLKSTEMLKLATSVCFRYCRVWRREVEDPEEQVISGFVLPN